MAFSSLRTQTEFAILPPARVAVSNIFQNVQTDRKRHDDLLAEMQRFRGRIYAADGAIPASALTVDGRHKVAADDHSWHVLSLDRDGRICACLRYLEETRAAGFDDLLVRHAAMAQSDRAREFRDAVEREMAQARQMNMGFGEVGGWAVAEQYRCTFEPLRIILATYGLLELLGGCVGVATATFRHKSAMILRRIGLAPLMSDGAALPPFFDPHYDCQMELLRFDSRFPNPKYHEAVRELSVSLMSVPVVRRENVLSNLHGRFRSFEIPVAGTAAMGNLDHAA
jgi:hypothetical protein